MDRSAATMGSQVTAPGTPREDSRDALRLAAVLYATCCLVWVAWAVVWVRSDRWSMFERPRGRYFAAFYVPGILYLTALAVSTWRIAPVAPGTITALRRAPLLIHAAFGVIFCLAVAGPGLAERFRWLEWTERLGRLGSYAFVGVYFSWMPTAALSGVARGLGRRFASDALGGVWMSAIFLGILWG